MDNYPFYDVFTRAPVFAVQFDEMHQWKRHLVRFADIYFLEVSRAAVNIELRARGARFRVNLNCPLFENPYDEPVGFIGAVVIAVKTIGKLFKGAYFFPLARFGEHQPVRGNRRFSVDLPVRTDIGVEADFIGVLAAPDNEQGGGRARKGVDGSKKKNKCYYQVS